MRKPKFSKRRLKKQLKKALIKMIRERPERFYELAASFGIQPDREPNLKESSNG